MQRSRTDYFIEFNKALDYLDSIKNEDNKDDIYLIKDLILESQKKIDDTWVFLLDIKKGLKISEEKHEVEENLVFKAVDHLYNGLLTIMNWHEYFDWE